MNLGGPRSARQLRALRTLAEARGGSRVLMVTVRVGGKAVGGVPQASAGFDARAEFPDEDGAVRSDVELGPS